MALSRGGRVGRWVLGSDSGGECGDGVRDPVPQIEVGAQFIVAAVEVCPKACSALITRAKRSRWRPRIGRSRAFRRP